MTTATQMALQVFFLLTTWAVALELLDDLFIVPVILLGGLIYCFYPTHSNNYFVLTHIINGQIIVLKNLSDKIKGKKSRSLKRSKSKN